MNAQQRLAFMIGALLGGIVAGALSGLIPLVLGVRKGKTFLAVGGFLASIVSGAILGMILAIPTAGVFAFLIARSPKPETLGADLPVHSLSARSGLACYLVLVFFGATVFCGVFWSLFMSLIMARSFVSTLIPAGVGFGLFMGIFFTAFMAISLHPVSITIPFQDRMVFLARLEEAAGKLRLRTLEKTERSLIYEPKALFRLEGARIYVELGPDAAMISGPWLSVRLLKKRSAKP